MADSVYFGDSRRDNAQDRDSGYGQNTYGGGPSDSYGGGPSGGGPERLLAVLRGRLWKKR